MHGTPPAPQPHTAVVPDPSNVSLSLSLSSEQADPSDPQTQDAHVDPSLPEQILLSVFSEQGGLVPHLQLPLVHMFTSSPVHSELELHRQLVPSQVSAVISHVGLVPQ